MLKRTLTAAALFTLLTCVIAFWNHIHLRPTDLDAYHGCIIEGSPQRSRRVLRTNPAAQERIQVQKDFWIPQGTSRNHLRIISKTSQLVLSEKSGKIEATEKLKNLEGWMIEQLSTDHKQVRHFTAQEGTYSYPSHQFFARAVSLSLFRNPGDDLLPSTAFLHGTAEEASFFACGAASVFTSNSAHHQALPGQQGILELFPTCKLSFSGASLDCDGPLTLRLQENLAHTDHPLHYQDAFVRIEAQNGRLTYLRNENQFKPQTIYCNGNVRLFSEESYALADQLVYFPETQTLHLFSQTPGRVLFWKSDGSIQISAPEVQARFDRKQQKEEIRGIGDVHFTFDLDDKNRIETFFGKYL